MSPTHRATLAPRILVLLGALINAAVVVLKIGGTAGPALHVVGGLMALMGVAWFLTVSARLRRRNSGQ